MSESMQSTSSGWSPVVLVLAVAIPLFLFWRPLRYLINEYRLYRRCQQYPHIIVCKDSSTTASSDRNSDGIIGLITQISVWLLGTLLSILGSVVKFFITTFTSKTSKTESTMAEQSLTELTRSSTEKTTYSDSGSRVQSSSIRSYYHSSVSNNSNGGAGVERNETKKQKFHVPIQSEEIFESSPQNNATRHHRNRTGLESIASEPVVQTRPSALIRTRDTAIRSRPPRHYSQTRIVPTATAFATVTKSVVFDSSSLSEKMRKRRLNGERIMGYDAITGGGDDGQSRKRRKLNGGRMPLQGSAVRHPRVGAWQTTRILDKREREQREERLLRSMSRKRVKPTVEVYKPATSTATSTSTAAPASSTPAFTFGQTPAATSTNPPAAATTATKQEAQAAASTPAPAFQFGASGSGTADKKSEPAAKAPAFSFGSTSTSTTSTATTSDASKAPAASAPAPAAPFQFGAPSDGTRANATTKSQPTEQGAFKFGSAPAPATSSAPPSFGAAPSASTPAVPLFGTSTNNSAPGTSAAPTPSLGLPKAATAAPASSTPVPPAFGANPASTPAAPAPSGFGAPAPAAPSFGSSTVPTTNFGASQPTKPATTPAFSFGNTKENTNPGGFNSSFQTPAQSNGFLKQQPTNTAAPSFGGMPAFSAGAPPASSSGASARRMARRAQRRRR